MNFHDEGNASSDKPDTFGLTCPLLMTKEGKKMGKTESGTLWVARDKTTSYAFYQYFYNTSDDDTEMLLKLFTDIPTSEIVYLCQSDIIQAKKRMAYEVTKLVHGEEDAQKAVEASQTLFSGGMNMENVPTIEFSRKQFDAGINAVDFSVETGFFASKGEARRMIQQGGLTIDDEKIISQTNIIQIKAENKDFLLLRKGKKNFLRVVLK